MFARTNWTGFPITKKLVGIAGSPFAIKTGVVLQVHPWFESQEVVKDMFWVLPRECDWLQITPTGRFDNICQPQQTVLADPEYFKPGEAHLLLGVAFTSRMMRAAEASALQGLRTIETIFGTVMLGVQSEKVGKVFCTYESNEEGGLDKLLTRLWEMDQIGCYMDRTAEEEMVENHFLQTHRRGYEGRFEVLMPLKESVADMGSSRNIALRQFMILERNLESNQELREKYVDKMREAMKAGYIKLAEECCNTKGQVYYIPHHCVTKKFRIVFNGSCRSDKGVSLNDVQLLGEKLQRDLHEIVMRFRRHRIAFCADIKGMYNQVNLAKEQWNLQRIFWRESRSEPLKEYCLTVVTFGLTSSAFLATRCVKQIAVEAREKFPDAANTIENDFYVDDCVSGADNVQAAVELARRVQWLLKGGGFHLCKWKSNDRSFLAQVDSEGVSSMVFSGEETQASVLGLRWLLEEDMFTFTVKTPELTGKVTKRMIVGCVAQLYDPNGYISPVIIIGKIMIQDLWRLNYGWDAKVSPELESKWKAYWETIQDLASFRIDRWVGMVDEVGIHLHGFSDASMSAYGAVIYVRAVHYDGRVTSRLLVSKARVAPVKKVTIPRLELAAACVLASLLVYVKRAMELEDVKYTLWTDSTVVLCWINKLPSNYKAYVANRVSMIQSSTDVGRWHHVGTKDYHADLLSRGMSPKELVQSNGETLLEEVARRVFGHFAGA